MYRLYCYIVGWLIARLLIIGIKLTHVTESDFKDDPDSINNQFTSYGPPHVASFRRAYQPTNKRPGLTSPIRKGSKEPAGLQETQRQIVRTKTTGK